MESSGDFNSTPELEEERRGHPNSERGNHESEAKELVSTSFPPHTVARCGGHRWRRDDSRRNPELSLCGGEALPEGGRVPGSSGRRQAPLPRRRALHANPRHADRSVARIDRCNRHHRPQRPQRSLTRSRGRCDSPSCVSASILTQCPCRTATLARSSRTGRQPIKHYSSNAIDRR